MRLNPIFLKDEITSSRRFALPALVTLVNGSLSMLVLLNLFYISKSARVTGEISYVKTVMRRNPDLDINRPRDSSGRTVLYIACMNGYVDLAKLFLEHKGDTTICDAET